MDIKFGRLQTLAQIDKHLVWRIGRSCHKIFPHRALKISIDSDFSLVI